MIVSDNSNRTSDAHGGSACTRVLFVSHSADLYGAERSFLTLIRGLAETGRVDPLVVLPRRGLLSDALKSAGIATVTARSAWWSGTPSLRRRVGRGARGVLNLVAALRLLRPVRSFCPSLVYTNCVVSPLGALFSRLLDAPHVLHVREFAEGALEFDLGRAVALRLLCETTDLVIFNSQAIRDFYPELVAGVRSTVILNGFAMPEWVEDAESRWTRCTLGRGPVTLQIAGAIQPMKGHEDAIRAVGVLAEKGHDVRLCILGDGRDAVIGELKRLANSLGVGERIEWKGFVGDVWPRHSVAAVGLVCSRSESFGRTAVEAMAAGVPIVATPVGGLSEIVTDGETGLLYKPGDYHGLAGCIERLLFDRALATGIARTARERVEARFAVDRYINEVIVQLDLLTGRGEDSRDRPHPSLIRETAVGER